MAPLAANGADGDAQGGEKGEWGMAVQVERTGGCEWTEGWRAELGAGSVVGDPPR